MKAERGKWGKGSEPVLGFTCYGGQKQRLTPTKGTTARRVGVCLCVSKSRCVCVCVSFAVCVFVCVCDPYKHVNHK